MPNQGRAEPVGDDAKALAAEQRDKVAKEFLENVDGGNNVANSALIEEELRKRRGE